MNHAHLVQDYGYAAKLYESYVLYVDNANVSDGISGKIFEETVLTQQVTQKKSVTFSVPETKREPIFVPFIFPAKIVENHFIEKPEQKPQFKANSIAGRLYALCIKTILKNGYNEIINTEGTFKGFIKDGLAHNQGKLFFEDVSYKGYFFEGDLHGRGKLTLAASTYIGTFKEGLYNGHGIETWTNGTRYEGSFVGGLKEGLGTLFFNNGKYVGEFADNVPEGQGVKTFLDGTEEKGIFVNETLHDKNATITSPTGIVYIGSVINGIIHGKGTVIYKDGSQYKGFFENGKFCG